MKFIVWLIEKTVDAMFHYDGMWSSPNMKEKL